MFFGLLGKLLPDSAETPPTPVVSRSSPIKVKESAAPAISISPLLTAEEPAPPLPTPLPKPPVLTHALPPDIGAAASAWSLYEKLDLVTKGFEFTSKEHGTPAFWTFRKVEPMREYSAIAMGNNDGTLTALTVELVATDPGLDTFAKSYFGAFAKAVVPASRQEDLALWMQQAVGTVATRNFGDLTVSLAGSGKSHRRITIQPK